MITVRKCRPEDESVWVKLNREFMAYEYKDENVWESPLEKGDPAEIFHAILSEPDGANLLLMVENDGHPIGFMNTVVFFSIWAHGKVLFLDDFFISVSVLTDSRSIYSVNTWQNDGTPKDTYLYKRTRPPLPRGRGVLFLLLTRTPDALLQAFGCCFFL